MSTAWGRVGVEHFSTADEWPPHSQSWWRETLSLAQEWGWTLETSGHWGVIRCPAKICNVRIYSSGIGSENPARDARKRITRCQHDPTASSVLAKIEDLLIKTSRLIDAAESLSAKDATEERAEMLGSAEEALDGGALWDEFGRLVDDAERHKDNALAAFAEVGLEPVDPKAALDLADGRVRQARTDLRAKGLPTGRVRSLDGFAKELRARIGAAQAA